VAQAAQSRTQIQSGQNGSLGHGWSPFHDTRDSEPKFGTIINNRPLTIPKGEKERSSEGESNDRSVLMPSKLYAGTALPGNCRQ
jgi:hypothetical protein